MQQKLRYHRHCMEFYQQILFYFEKNLSRSCQLLWTSDGFLCFCRFIRMSRLSLLQKLHCLHLRLHRNEHSSYLKIFISERSCASVGILDNFKLVPQKSSCVPVCAFGSGHSCLFDTSTNCKCMCEVVMELYLLQFKMSFKLEL